MTITGAEGASDPLTVNGLGGNDTIDASGLAGRPDQPHDQRRRRQRHASPAAQGNDLIIGGRGNDTRRYGSGRRHVRLEPRRRQRHRRGPGAAATRCCSTAPTSTRTSTSRPTARVPGCSATSATSRWTSTTSRPSTSTPWAAPTRSPSTTCPDRRQAGQPASLPAAARRRPGRYGHRQRHQWRRRDQRHQRQRRGHGVGSGRDGEHHGPEANDRIVINGLAGDDVIEASGLRGQCCSRPMAATATTC